LLRGRIGVILRAKRDALIGLPRILAKRKLERHMRIVDADTLIKTMKRGVLTPYLNRHE
jgi:hypothetical protein